MDEALCSKSCLNEATCSLSDWADSVESAEFWQNDALFGGEADLRLEWSGETHDWKPVILPKVAEATRSCTLIFNKVAVDPLEGQSFTAFYYAIFFESMLRVPQAWTLVTPVDGHGMGLGQQETLQS